MTEDKNIRNALHQEESNRPPMPADLNSRLMLRVEKEVNSKPEKKRTRIVLPWIAAACVAVLIAVFLMPPESTQPSKGELEITQTEEYLPMQAEPVEDVKPQSITADIEPKIKATTKVHTQKVDVIDEQFAKVEIPQENTEEPKQEIAVIEDTSAAQPQPRMLTERDIPITRPENYKYTKEEIALMKRQANEAYLKWVELELEISKYNLENTAER